MAGYRLVQGLKQQIQIDMMGMSRCAQFHEMRRNRKHALVDIGAAELSKNSIGFRKVLDHVPNLHIASDYLSIQYHLLLELV